MIVQRGNKWVLYTGDGSRILGIHPSHAKALRQEVAIRIRKQASSMGILPFILEALDDPNLTKEGAGFSGFGKLVSRLFSRPSSIVRAAEAPAIASAFRLPAAAVIDPVELNTLLHWKGYKGPTPVLPRAPRPTGPVSPVALVQPELRESVQAFRNAEAARYGRGIRAPAPTPPPGTNPAYWNQWIDPEYAAKFMPPGQIPKGWLVGRPGVAYGPSAFATVPPPMAGPLTARAPGAVSAGPTSLFEPSARIPLPSRAIRPISMSELGIPGLQNLPTLPVPLSIAL